MPRQPYLQVVRQPKGAAIDVGTKAIGQRPELETLVGNCLMAWPHAEAEMALLLGQLLGTGNAAALAVFQHLRRSSAQRDAISEAASAALDSTDRELVSAVLDAHKTVEAERNALTHGHFGTSSKLPDALIWMNTNDYVTVRVEMTLRNPIPQWDDKKHLDLLSRISVYRKTDLSVIFDDTKEIADIWFNLIQYLRHGTGTNARARKYHQLCDRSHIARALAKLRQKNTPLAPSR